MNKKIAQPEVEKRTFQAPEFRVKTYGNSPVLEGYSAVFNEYSADLGGFVEIIEPGFFDDVMTNDVRALLNHDQNYVMGRTTSKTLEIEQHDSGLFARIHPPEATWMRDLMVSIDRGDVNQQSFAFITKSTYRGDAVDGDEWYVMGEKIVRRLRKGGCKELLDVSIVTYPAYPQTDVSANTRSRFEQFTKSLTDGQASDGQAQGNAGQASLDVLQRQLDLASK